jgi:hypothetical protein
MNIEQVKQQYAELAELDKQRTQGEWVAEHDNLEPEMPYSRVLSLDGYIDNADYETGVSLSPENANFIAQAPAMFKMIGELITRVETLEQENEILNADILLHSDAHLAALQKIKELEAWQENAVKVLNAYNEVKND